MGKIEETTPKNQSHRSMDLAELGSSASQDTASLRNMLNSNCLAEFTHSLLSHPVSALRNRETTLKTSLQEKAHSLTSTSCLPPKIQEAFLRNFEKILDAAAPVSNNVLTFFEHTAEVLSKAKGIELTHNALVTLSKAYRRESYKRDLNNLVVRIDYDALVELSEQDSTKVLSRCDRLADTLRKVQILRSHQFDEQENRKTSVSEIKVRHSFVKDLHEELKTSGCLLATPHQQRIDSPIFGPPAQSIRLRTLQELKKAFDANDIIVEHIGYYRKPLNTFGLNLNFKVERLRAHLESNSTHGEIDLDPELTAAIKRYAERALSGNKFILENFLRNNQDQKNPGVSDKFQAVQTILITGLTPPAGAECIYTDHDLRYKLLNWPIPKEWLEYVKKIEFSTTSLATLSSIIDAKEALAGGFKRQYDRDGNITSVEVEVAERIFYGADSKDLHELLVKISDETILHELGHYGRYLFTPDEIVAWADLLEKDPTSVTAYVKSSRGISRIQSLDEDFAESFSMFVNEPNILYILSPSRYVFIYEFLSERLDESERALLNEHLRERSFLHPFNGYDKEEIKRIYLKHEIEGGY